VQKTQSLEEANYNITSDKIRCVHLWGDLYRLPPWAPHNASCIQVRSRWAEKKSEDILLINQCSWVSTKYLLFSRKQTAGLHLWESKETASAELIQPETAIVAGKAQIGKCWTQLIHYVHEFRTIKTRYIYTES